MHVVNGTVSFFLWLSNISGGCVYTATQHIFKRSSTDRYLRCFRILAAVSKADINTGVHVPFQISVFIFTGCIPRVELLDHMTVLSFLGGSVVKKLPAMQEIWVRSLGQEDPLQKGTATQSSILAWEVPWTQEPGGLQSCGVTESGT